MYNWTHKSETIPIFLSNEMVIIKNDKVLLHENYVLVVGDKYVHVLLVEHKNVTVDLPFSIPPGKLGDTCLDP